MANLLSTDEINKWYDENPIQLEWLEKPSRHQFRWRNVTGKWMQNKKKISKPSQLNISFRNKPPLDLYYGTAEWLEPVGLPRLREKNKPAPILLDHLVVFDIDKKPFCRLRLEQARKITSQLLKWLKTNENLELLYVCYSGGKGFHVVMKDLDRNKFSIPDPREREKIVRQERKQLLHRVLDAGFEVDKTVTADTRRIIRVPTSLHGGTGWVCTIIEETLVHTPIKHWLNEIPRHDKSKKLKFWVPKTRRKKNKRPRQKKLHPAEDKGSSIVVEASTHVNGTKDRSVLLAWLPEHWSEKRKNKFYNQLSQDGLSPCHIWKSENRELILVPLSLQKKQMMRKLKKLGLISVYSQYQKLGHAWIEISPRQWENGEIDNDFTYLGVLESNRDKLPEPWSNPHLQLVQQLGGSVEMENLFSESFIGAELFKLRISEYD